jgi:hypothetical protein
VVRVVEDLGDDAPRFVPLDFLLVDQDTHELRDGDRRVGVYDAFLSARANRLAQGVDSPLS